MAVKKCRKVPFFHVKGSAFAAVNRDKMFQTRYVKGVPFLKEGIQEDTLLAKNGI